jgi:hypothetical protein
MIFVFPDDALITDHWIFRLPAFARKLRRGMPTSRLRKEALARQTDF